MGDGDAIEGLGVAGTGVGAVVVIGVAVGAAVGGGTAGDADGDGIPAVGEAGVTGVELAPGPPQAPSSATIRRVASGRLRNTSHSSRQGFFQLQVRQIAIEMHLPTAPK